jgi:precorrin-3B synthase
MTASEPELDVSQVRGWCPGALRPMQSGDGLIVRLRPHGHLTPAQLLALAALAERHGNGLIDLTRRANIQMRGVEAASLPALWGALAELDLLDAGAEAEAVRNVLSSPLAGIDKSELLDPRPLVASLESALSYRPELWALPAKFCFVVDGGGALPLDEERADIRLLAVQDLNCISLAVGRDGPNGVEWLGATAPDLVCAAALDLATHFFQLGLRTGTRMRDVSGPDRRQLQAGVAMLAPLGSAPAYRAKRHPLGVIENCATTTVAFAAPFGRIGAVALRCLAQRAVEAGAKEVRISPWRSFYVPVPDREAGRSMIAAAVEAGLIVDPTDPLLSIDACPGVAGCTSSQVDTRAAAMRLAPALSRMGVRTCHVSGCSKGCARSGPADLTLVGVGDCFGVLRYDTAQGKPLSLVRPASLPDLPEALKSA